MRYIYALDKDLKKQWASHKERIFKLGGFTVHLASDITPEDLQTFSYSFEKIILAIQHSPVKNFKKVLKGHVYVGTKDDLCKWQGCKVPPFSNGMYSQKFKVVDYFTDGLRTSETWVVLIHEFAHKFHVEEVPNGLRNQGILDLYEELKEGLLCYDKAELPKLGDPLSKYTKPQTYRGLVGTGKELYLTEIDGVPGEGAEYHFSNDLVGVIKEEKSLIQSLHCPSMYAYHNHAEWFAEMVTMITLEELPPKDYTQASKLLKLLNS